jgi:hypothetical protein
MPSTPITLNRPETRSNIPSSLNLQTKGAGNGFRTLGLVRMENRFLALIVSCLVVLVAALALATPTLNGFDQPETAVIISVLRK